MKDFYDIWTLQRQMDFEKSNLLESIRLTFSNRQTKLNKDSIHDLRLLGESEMKDKQWKHFIRKNQFNSKTPNFKEIINKISFFLKSFVADVDKESTLN